jgi:hypothetical protein
VRARTKDLGCHKDEKNLSSPEVLALPAVADVASEQKGTTGCGGCWVCLGNKEGQGGGALFIPRERWVLGFRV